MCKHKILVATPEKGQLVEAYAVNLSFQKLQDAVGGYFEPCAPVEIRERNIQMLTNTMGLFKGLPPNNNLYPFFYVGNIVFVGVAGDEFVGLTDEQLEFVKAWLKKLDEPH